MKISKPTAKTTLAIALSLMCTGAFAANTVIGSVRADSTVIVNPGAAQQKFDNSQFVYIQGEILSTVGSESAKIMLTSGDALITLAPNSIASISSIAPLTLSLSKGAVDFTASAGMAVTIDSPTGAFTLTSATGINAVVVLNEGQLSIIPRVGNVSVQSEAGNSFSTVEEGNALVASSANDAKVVEAAFLLPLIATIGTTGLIVGAALTAVIAREVTKDDPVEEPPVIPVASPG
ncbi:MAG: hypothetical protein ACI854_001223 [Arenicella sp.]|jgi:hypothetical protein